MQTPSPAGQKADPRSQAIFNMAFKQGAKMLSSQKAAAAIARDAKTRGPGVAIVEALRLVISVMRQAAGNAGVQISPDVLQAVIMSLAQLLAAMMASSGLAQSPQQVMADVQKAVVGSAPGPAGQPQQPAQAAQAAAPQQPAASGLLSSGGA